MLELVQISYMMTKEGLTIDEALDVMNKKSGILGISGKSSDLREVLARNGRW